MYIHVHYYYCFNEVKFVQNLAARAALEASGAALTAPQIKTTLDYRIAVLSKRKIHLYEYSLTTRLFVEVKELSCPEGALTVQWYHGTILVATRREYCFIDVINERVLNVVPKEKANEKGLTLVVGKEFMITKESNGFFYGPDGSATLRNITFTAPPKLATYQFPFLVTVNAQCVDIHNLYNNTRIQSIGLNEIAMSQGLSLYAGEAPSLNSIFRQIAFSGVTSYGNSVLFFSPLPVDLIVQEMLKAGRCDEAINFFNYVASGQGDGVAMIDYESRLSHIRLEAGFMLLHSLQFPAAFSQLKQSRDCDPRAVIGLFPDLAVPSSPFYKETNNINTIIQRQLQGLTQEKLFETLVQAHMCLMDFLESRVWESDDVRMEVNTALIKLYVRYRPTEVVPLLKRSVVVQRPDPQQPPQQPTQSTANPGAAAAVSAPVAQKSQTEEVQGARALYHIAAIEPYLIEAQFWTALGLVYVQIGDVEKGLALWRQLGRGEIHDRMGQHENGVACSVETLRSVSDARLVFEYSKWIFEKDQAAATQIFIDAPRKPQLNNDEVLSFLVERGEEPLTDYLEYMVEKRGVTDERYITQLCGLHIQRVVAMCQILQQQPSRINPGEEGGILGTARKRLLTLLRSDLPYNPAALVPMVEQFDLCEEKIELFQKLGAHSRALQVILNDLSDYERAERYCLVPREDDERQVRFMELLALYISSPRQEHLVKLPSRGKPVIFSRKAIELINKYGRYLNFSAVVRVLPPELPLQSLLPFFGMGLQEHTHRLNDTLIMKSLVGGNNNDLRAKLSKAYQQFAKVEEYTRCAVCGEKIGTKVFYKYPNGVLVCFRCIKDKNVCPLTGRDFEKDPWPIDELNFTTSIQ